MKRILYLAWGLLLTATLHAQTPCNSESFLKTFTSNSSIGVGLTLCASGDGNLYASGLEENRTVLLKLTPNGDVIWSRSFSLDPIVPVAISEMIVDSDGMLVAAGIQTSLQQGNPQSLVFRYNPNTNTVLWSKSFVADSVIVDGIIEKSPGGNYVFYQTSFQPFTEGVQAEILELNRTTGNLVPGLARRYTLNNIAGLARVISHQGALYAVGTAQTLSTPVLSLRTLLTRLDASNGQPTWANVTNAGTSSDFAGIDILADDNALVTLSSDAFLNFSVGTGSSSIYLQKNDLNGNLMWLKKYDSPVFSGLAAAEVVKLGNGYAIYGVGADGLALSQVLILVDNDGNVQTTKQLDGFDASAQIALRGEAIVLDIHLYLAGTTARDSDIDWSILKTDATLTLNTNCGNLQTVAGTQAQSLTDAVATPVTLTNVASSTPAVNRPISLASMTIASQLVCSGCQTNCTEFRDQIVILTPGGSVVVKGVTYTAPATVTVTEPSTTGCDVVTTFIIQFSTTVTPQQCDANSFLKTFTSGNSFGSGQTLCASGDGNLFASGLVENRTTLLKVSQNGDVIWSRSFSLNDVSAVAISEMFVDSDGMLVAAGIQASLNQTNPASLVFRYNPNTNTVLWSKSFAADSVTVDGIAEKSPGSNYIFHQTSFAPFTAGVQAEVLEINRSTGNIVPSLAVRFGLNNALGIARIVPYQGALYAVGTVQTLPIPVISLRTLLMRLNASGQPVWSNVNYGAITSEDLIGVDLLVDNNALLTLSSGTLINGSTLEPVSMYLQKNDLNGNLIWMRKYNSPSFSNILGSEIVKLNNGYAVYGVGTGNLDVSQIIILLDNNGNVLTTKRLGGFDQSGTLALRGEAISIDNHIFATGTVSDGSNSLDVDWSLLKADSALTISANCAYLQTAGTTQANMIFDPTTVAVDLDISASSTPAINQPIAFTNRAVSSQLLCYACEDRGILTLTCDANITVTTNAGEPTTIVDYDLPTATTTCPSGSAVTFTLLSGPPVGSPFPVGVTTICYLAQDQCGNTATCCFTVTALQGENTCDSKTNGCFRWELLPIKLNALGERRYRIKITNNCAVALDYVAFQVPDGVNAEAPADGSTYTDAISGRTYLVRNPNFSPFYSVRFKTTPNVMMNGGVFDILEYTLPQQSQPQYIHTLAKFRDGTTVEAFLNTFNCPIVPFPLTTDPSGAKIDNPSTAIGLTLGLYPNPTNGRLLVDLSVWEQQSLRLEVLNAQGQLVQTMEIEAAGHHSIDLDGRLPNGLYQLVVRSSQGEPVAEPFILQRN